MKRMGLMIGIRPETIPEYKRLHADVWPEILDRLSKSNITNYSIFLREPENLMFSYFEYLGSDFEADNQAIADDPTLVNSDPLGAAWFFKLKVADASVIDQFMDEAAYNEMIG